MEENKIDQLNKEAFLFLGYEKPPANFTSTVMDTIFAENAGIVKKYRPAIGKWGWIGLSFALIFLAVGLWYFSGSQDTGNEILLSSLYKKWDLDFLQPLLSCLVRMGSQLQLVIIIGTTATLILLADRLIAVKLKGKLHFS